MCGSGSPRGCHPVCCSSACGYRRGSICTRSILVENKPVAAGASPGSRRGRMLAESAAVEEVPVWLEVNGEPAVTWMCTPDLLEELATGWLHGEGYIQSLDDLVKLRPCATDLGFWADIWPERLAAAQAEHR